jgi:hypothetical protein
MLFDPEDGCYDCLRNVGNKIPVNMRSCPRRLYSSALGLYKEERGDFLNKYTAISFSRMHLLH